MPQTTTTTAATAPDNVPDLPERPTRTKSPKYDVYRVNEEGHLVPLATDVAAPTRKKAIEKQDDPYGAFATVRTGEVKLTTRKQTTKPVDVWE